MKGSQNALPMLHLQVGGIGAFRRVTIPIPATEGAHMTAKRPKPAEARGCASVASSPPSRRSVAAQRVTAPGGDFTAPEIGHRPGAQIGQPPSLGESIGHQRFGDT